MVFAVHGIEQIRRSGGSACLPLFSKRKWPTFQRSQYYNATVDGEKPVGVKTQEISRIKFIAILEHNRNLFRRFKLAMGVVWRSLDARFQLCDQIRADSPLLPAQSVHRLGRLIFSRRTDTRAVQTGEQSGGGDYERCLAYAK